MPPIGNRLEVSSDYFNETIVAFTILSLRITQGILRRFVPEEKEPADQHLNEIGLKFITKENYALADKIFDFALSIPDKHLSSDFAKKRFIINKCLGLYHLKKGKEMEALLSTVDWSAMHTKFILAVNVLREKWDVSTELMPKSELTAEMYRDWPLFREFRKTTQFRTQYKAQFGQDFAYQPKMEIESGSDGGAARTVKEKEVGKAQN